MPALDPRLLKGLYRHAAGEDGRRRLFENDPTFAKGWLNLDNPATAALIAAMVPLDDIENVRQAQKAAQANLEAVAWNDELGITAPQFPAEVKIHGRKWGLRFVEHGNTLRGRSALNRVPAIPSDQTGNCPAGEAGAQPSIPPSGGANDTAAAAGNAAADMLAAWGAARMKLLVLDFETYYDKPVQA